MTNKIKKYNAKDQIKQVNNFFICNKKTGLLARHYQKAHALDLQQTSAGVLYYLDC